LPSPSSPDAGDPRSPAWLRTHIGPWQTAVCAPGPPTSRCFGSRTVSAPCPARPIRRSACRCFPGGALDHHSDARMRPTRSTLVTAMDRWDGRARAFRLRRAIPFTSAYHTRAFPIFARPHPLPLSWSYGLNVRRRRFHAPSAACWCGAVDRDELTQRGFRNLVHGPSVRRQSQPSTRARMRNRGGAADLALWRPRCDREDIGRSFPRSPPALHQMGGGRRPAAQD